jgi:hypothetical protein
MMDDVFTQHNFESMANQALELTGKKLALFPSSSPPAFGFIEKEAGRHETKGDDHVVSCRWVHRDAHPEPPHGATRG